MADQATYQQSVETLTPLLVQLGYLTKGTQPEDSPEFQKRMGVALDHLVTDFRAISVGNAEKDVTKQHFAAMGDSLNGQSIPLMNEALVNLAANQDAMTRLSDWSSGESLNLVQRKLLAHKDFIADDQERTRGQRYVSFDTPEKLRAVVELANNHDKYTDAMKGFSENKPVAAPEAQAKADVAPTAPAPVARTEADSQIDPKALKANFYEKLDAFQASMDQKLIMSDLNLDANMAMRVLSKPGAAAIPEAASLFGAINQLENAGLYKPMDDAEFKPKYADALAASKAPVLTQASTDAPADSQANSPAKSEFNEQAPRQMSVEEASQVAETGLAGLAQLIEMNAGGKLKISDAGTADGQFDDASQKALQEIVQAMGMGGLIANTGKYFYTPELGRALKTKYDEMLASSDPAQRDKASMIDTVLADENGEGGLDHFLLAMDTLHAHNKLAQENVIGTIPGLDAETGNMITMVLGMVNQLFPDIMKFIGPLAQQFLGMDINQFLPKPSVEQKQREFADNAADTTGQKAASADPAAEASSQRVAFRDNAEDMSGPGDDQSFLYRPGPQQPVLGGVA